MALPSIRIGLEGLDAQAVQRGRAVEHDRVLLDHLFQDVPDHRRPALRLSFLAALMVVAMPMASSAREDEGLEQLQRHQLGQAALVQLERRARPR